MAAYPMTTCAHCNGTVIREEDRDGPRLVCLQCGRSPRIAPLGEWYARQELFPTEDYWPRDSKAPPTKRYE